MLRQQFAHPAPPVGPTADAYRLVGYQDGLVGNSDELQAHYDSGLTWPDSNNPRPDDPLWGGGVDGGVKWDGTFYRDLSRYGQSGSLFWSAYLKPGSAPGSKNGYWINFGCAYSHLLNDDPAQLLTGASQRLYYDPATALWTLIIQATDYVTHEVREVWTGTKAGGNDPTGNYARITGCDPTATLTVEAV